MQPFVTQVDFRTGFFKPQRSLIQRRLSDMAQHYADRARRRPHPG